MVQFFQSTVFGQVMRLLTNNKVLRYPDEIDPSLWKQSCQQQEQDSSTPEPEPAPVPAQTSSPEPSATDKEARNGEAQREEPDEKKTKNTSNDFLVVGWYGADDPENPQNWPIGLKHLLAFQMCLLNFAVYIASSIYVPGETELIAEFGVSEIVATLGLSLFTLGYGVGPMLWSPLSEMPRLGRTGIFLGTLFAFVIFQLPVGFAPNIAVFLVFRWVTGFCGSPCLATGGGTINDIYPGTLVPYFLCIWSWAGVLGPVFGPVIGGYLAPAQGWRWTIWVFTWLCSLVFIMMFFLFPETSAANILYRRAKRLRKATGNDRIRSQSEVDSAGYTVKDNLILVGRAFTLIITEPIVLLIDLYAALLYGILFLWFESFPIVFGGTYGFSSGQQGLVYFGILVFTVLTAPFFLLWIKKRLVPSMKSGTFKPEMLFAPTFVGSLSLPVCLFWFGWTSREGVHWIVPIIGSGFFAIAVVTLFNSVYMYIGIIYAPYAASIFAGAALFRASLGATFPLFARALFNTLGVGPGSSLLGGISILFIPVPVILYFYGERIRRWSKHAG